MATVSKKRKTVEPSEEEEAKEEMQQPQRKTRAASKREQEEKKTDKAEEQEDEEEGGEEDEEQHKEAEDESVADSAANREWLLEVLEDAHLQALGNKDESGADKKATLKEYETTFARIANRLLNEVAIVINGKPHRLAEIEYYYEGGNHHDTFTHCDELQQTSGKWYFHKSGSSYKGGSYKGLDITFGGQTGSDGKKAYGGILIRAIEALSDAAQPSIIEGPSLVVDHILNTCKAGSIVNFVTSFGSESECPPAHHAKGRKLYLAPISQVSSPSVHYVPTKMETLTVRTSPRVGLTLKKVREGAEIFIMKAYRYFIYPQLMKKGKTYMICALHFVDGLDVAAIQKVSKTGKATIENYLRDFETGKAKNGNVESFRNLNLNAAQLCQLYGAVSCLL